MPPRRPPLRPNQRFHYTILGVTINTLVAATTDDDERYLTNALREYLQDRLFTDGDKLESLIVMDHGKVEYIEIDDGEVEVGGEQRRVHAHFTMTILHSGSVNLGPMQRLWQDIIGEDLQFMAPRGIYVRLDLLDSRAHNYAIKDAQSVEEIIPP